MPKCTTEGCLEYSSILHEGNFYCEKCMYKEIIQKTIKILEELDIVNKKIHILGNIILAIKLKNEIPIPS